jgi:hypothetical protein
MQNCPKCGRPVKNRFFCPSCGQSLTEGLNEGGAPPPQLPTAAKTDSAPAAEAPAIRQTAAANVAQSKQSRIWLLLIVVAVAGIGSLMLFAASRRAAATPPVNVPHEIRVDKALENTRAPEPAHGPSPQWITKGPSRRGFNGISFELAADEDVDVWRKRVRPVLTVRCTPKETEVFVWTQSAASIEPTGQHTVQVTFDDARSAAETWEHSVDHDALFAPDGKALMRQIARAHTMSFTFTPFNASPALVRFSVDGFDEQMKSATKACGWKSPE